MILCLLAGLAGATSAFDPTDPVAVFTGDETWTQSGDLKLWSSIQRWADPNPLFVQESFNDALEWQDADYSPWIATAFGKARPHSGTFLLHAGPTEPVATGTPILMIPGAGDNGSRGFITLATHFDREARPVYAITFAHPHGDVLRQAEIVADAIAVIKERTGAAQVDLVAHSKGGLAAAVYLSNTAQADWGRPDYEQHGTPYRGDVRRAVFIASPLGGIDTAYRWSSSNLFAIDEDLALAPSAWKAWYPSGTAVWALKDDLTAQDFLPGGAGDLFPGQRQLLRRQPYDLPGSQSWMMGYALQTDWYTTYEGGLGFFSDSDGIDAAIAAGDQLLDRLEVLGADPAVELFLLAGSLPVMPNGDDTLAASFAEAGSVSSWAELVSRANAHGVPFSMSSDELQGLADGQIVLGEISGPSDGLVFVSSATHAEALTARGAVVVDTRVAELSHLDLLYASPVTGGLLSDAGELAAEDAWMKSWGDRYTEADTIGWVDDALADAPVEDPGEDTGAPLTDVEEEPDETTDPPAAAPRPCGGCTGTPGLVGPWLLVPLWWRRREKEKGCVSRT